MKNLPHFFFKLFLIALAVFTAAGFYFWQARGMRFYSVKSGSMAPTLQVGDLVIDKKVSSQSIKTGDVISYASLADQLAVITHRVIRADAKTGFITTQGDNLETPDPPVAYGAVLGKSVQVIPVAGYLFDTLRNPLGLVALIYIPVVAIGIIEIRKLASHYRNPYKHPKLL